MPPVQRSRSYTGVECTPEFCEGKLPYTKISPRKRAKSGGSREQGSSKRPVGAGFHGAEVHWPQIAPPIPAGCAEISGPHPKTFTTRAHKPSPASLTFAGSLAAP